MKKVELNNFSENAATKLYEGNYTVVYRTKDGQILKKFSPYYLKFLRAHGMDLEEKILNATLIFGVPEVVIPTSAIYSRGQFIGFSADEIEGCNLNQFCNRLSFGQRGDLKGYADLYSAVESPVKRASNLVFPDLCTIDNIMITRDGDVRFVDYDGIQVGEYISPSFSTMLGDQEQYSCSKYLRDGRYTKQLDIKSLINFYFIMAFNVDLNYVGKISGVTGNTITLDDIFRQIGLEDETIKHKVWKSMQSSGENEYLGDDVYRLAEDYRMNVYMHPSRPRTYIKILEKK